MKYELSYDLSRDLIKGRAEGEIEPSLVKTIASEQADIVKTSGYRKLLNDLRSAQITLSTFDIYNMPRIVDEQGVPLTCKRALLVSKASTDLDFLETVSVNVWQFVRIFSEMDEALEWLNESEASASKQDDGFL